MVVFDTEDERKILSHITDGLGAAVYATGVSFGANATHEFRKERDIRTNKLVQQAVEAADIPVLWSWFRYGQSVANSKAMGREVTHEPLSQDEEEMAAIDAHPNAKSKKWYKKYFINDVAIGDAKGLKQICQLSLPEFLEAAYDEAPDEHQPLYKANLEMQEMLRDIALSDDWHNQDPGGDFYQDVWQVSRELQEKLILNEEILRKDTRLISEYLRLVRRAVATTCATDGSQIDEDIQSDLYSLADIYHDPVWKLAAMRISSTTVHGRNKRTKRSEFRGEANDLQGDVKGTISAYRVNLQKTGLLRDLAEWSLSNEELESYTRRSESALLS
jgi:hypothetical protein